MASKDGVVYTYNDTVQGQIQVGSVDSGWMRTDRGLRDGFSELLLMGSITNSTGATTVIVDQSFDGVNVAFSSPDQLASIAAGVKLPVSAPWVRVRITQTTAATSTAKLAVKASD